MNSATELGFLHDWAGWMCHQLPQRSPQCAGEVFPVCFRCAGLHLGLAAAYLQMFFSGAWRGRFPSVRMVLFCAGLMLPLMIDGAGNALQFWNSPGWWRGITGLGVGLGLPWLLAPLAQSLEFSTDRRRKPSLENSKQIFLPALAGIVAIALLDCDCAMVVFQAFAAAAAAGWYLFLAHFILALVRAYGGGIARLSLSWFQRTELNG